MISEGTLDKVRELPIESIVEPYVKLSRDGRLNMKGLCPFHSEKTPSFSLNLSKNLYHCFGCNRGGDGIRFIMEKENLSFTDAVHFLAKQHGIPVDYEKEEEQSGEAVAEQKHKESLLATLDILQTFFVDSLRLATTEDSRNARCYAYNRWPEDFCSEAGLGYAPKDSNVFRDFCQQKGLKEELRNRSIPTKSLKEDATVESLKAVLRNDRENIFIPTSGSNITLIKILPQLTLLVREKPDSRIHLFGYPEWQTYTKDHLEAFFELDTYFYSSFYTNNLLPAAINFTKSYRKWYGKDMDERYPKFGMLGFDTGYFFLKGLSRYGSGFEKNLNEMNLVPIQTGFKFQRVNNWGGFINRKVFFVHFTKNFELIKLDFD